MPETSEAPILRCKCMAYEFSVLPATTFFLLLLHSLFHPQLAVPFSPCRAMKNQIPTCKLNSKRSKLQSMLMPIYDQVYALSTNVDAEYNPHTHTYIYIYTYKCTRRIQHTHIYIYIYVYSVGLKDICI